MKRLSNIGAIAVMTATIMAYIVYSFGFGIKVENLNIMYALVSHSTMIVFASIFFTETKNNTLRFLSLYVIVFFSLAIALFVVLGLLYDEAYFRYKLCMYLSIIITATYETIVIARKLPVIYRNVVSSMRNRFIVCCSVFLPKIAGNRKGQTAAKQQRVASGN